ncbi:DUF2442 domain-containing protein [bacterium]|nr:DUF2442 domain-containing protein [bacterium]MBU1615775.1 DUF2442 domain-containing protein [bacterium]
MIKIIEAVPCNNYTLAIKLDNGKSGIFNVTPFLDKGIFQELKDKHYFEQVHVRGRSIFWPHEQDFCADTIDELMTT